MTDRTILLNPGPVTLSDGVRDALARGDWCHREAEFAELTRSINRRLVDVYDSDHDEYAAVLLTGSGTCAVEAMIATHAPRNTHTLVVANGVYGERMARMLTQLGRPHELLQSDWTGPIDLDAVAARLQSDSRISHVVAVQHETTTGRLNDIENLGKLCLEHDVALLLDSVSAFGAEEIRFAEWNVEALAATANKCLHGVPGISFVIARRSSLSQENVSAGSVYLDLRAYYATQHGDGFSPFTLSVQCIFALDVALQEFFAGGGWQARRSRYEEVATRISTLLDAMGVRPLLSDGERSATMYSYFLPEGMTYAHLHDALKRDGFIIYAGQGGLSGRIFRIAHMGDIRDTDVTRLLDSLDRAICR